MTGWEHYGNKGIKANRIMITEGQFFFKTSASAHLPAQHDQVLIYFPLLFTINYHFLNIFPFQLHTGTFKISELDSLLLISCLTILSMPSVVSFIYCTMQYYSIWYHLFNRFCYHRYYTVLARSASARLKIYFTVTLVSNHSLKFLISFTQRYDHDHPWP